MYEKSTIVLGSLSILATIWVAYVAWAPHYGGVLLGVGHQNATMLAEEVAALKESLNRLKITAANRTSASASVSPRPPTLAPPPVPPAPQSGKPAMRSTKDCLRTRNNDDSCDILIVQVDSRSYKPVRDLPNYYQLFESVTKWSRVDNPEAFWKVNMYRGRTAPEIFNDTGISINEGTFLANYLYSRMRGYHYLRVTLDSANPMDGRHPSWEKLAVVRSLLENFRTILMLDSDAFVRDWRVNLEQERANCRLDLKNDNVILVSQEGAPSGGCVNNGGVWMVHRTVDTLKFFADWWNGLRGFEQWRVGWAQEQSIGFRYGAPVYEQWRSRMCVKPAPEWLDATWYGPWSTQIAHHTAYFVLYDGKWASTFNTAVHAMHMMDCRWLPRCQPPTWNISDVMVSVNELDFTGIFDGLSRVEMLKPPDGYKDATKA